MATVTLPRPVNGLDAGFTRIRRRQLTLVSGDIEMRAIL
jgi:hypothetical protein